MQSSSFGSIIWNIRAKQQNFVVSPDDLYRSINYTTYKLDSQHLNMSTNRTGHCYNIGHHFPLHMR